MRILWISFIFAATVLRQWPRLTVSSPRHTFSATKRDEHEVLMHHSDAGGDGVIGGVNVNGFSIDDDLAFVRTMQAIDQIHQCTFARSVFSEQGMDLAFAQIKVDIVTGEYLEIVVMPLLRG
jgi:hypothetical protein